MEHNIGSTWSRPLCERTQSVGNFEILIKDLTPRLREKERERGVVWISLLCVQKHAHAKEQQDRSIVVYIYISHRNIAERIETENLNARDSIFRALKQTRL